MATNEKGEKFTCFCCDYNTSRKDLYFKHIQTKKHRSNEQKGEISPSKLPDDAQSNNQVKKGEICLEATNVATILPPFFSCDCCNFSTDSADKFAAHVETKRHMENKKIVNFSCELCSHVFQTRSGLWRHKKLCTELTPITNDNALKTFIIDLMKSQQETNQQILQSNRDLVELCMKQTGQNTNSQNTINSHNTQNTFNLQLFLNETCKDSLNLTDFIKTIKVGLEDIERIGQVGYVDGITDVILRNLKSVGIEKRPIHCTDAKRETIYVKENDVWTKEEEALNLIQNMINEVQRMNLRQLPLWREKHPSCLSSNSMYTDLYLNISQELMGGDCAKVDIRKKDNKIFKNIAKEVTINKTQFAIIN
jgi:hypothetical protein